MIVNNTKNFTRILLDLSTVAFSFIAATNLRILGLETTETTDFILNEQLFKVIGIVVIIKFICLSLTGVYKKFWRYTKVEDLIQLGQALVISSLIISLPRFIAGISPAKHDLLAISFGIIIIDFFLSLCALASIRLLRFYLKEQNNIKERLKTLSQTSKATLVIGAGEGGIQVIEAIKSHPELGLEIKAILDDDKKKHGMNIIGSISVKGAIEDVKYWVDELAIEQIIIAVPSFTFKEKKRISLLCNETGVDVRIVPSVDQLAGGQVDIREIRKLSMEDLLGREEINLDTPEIIDFLKDKRVLVTGAGGSIGRELCKQLMSHGNIAKLCLLGKGENSIFESKQDLERLKSSLNKNIELSTKICDICNQTRMEHIISEFKPDIIYHAAAHKHVYLMEQNPCEAFENNVLGSNKLMQLASKYKVKNFVLISTDKAVNPTSIMGKTKRLAEKLLLTNAKQNPETKFTAVRFGNVLGSRGSVITVWQKQIEDGKSITVTDPKAIRYFMTIPEASQLVIQAASKAHSGEIMVLDMGEPINIYELAKQFIKLSGFSEADIDIEFTGMRPGEKMYEELLTSEEFIDSKLTDKIFKARIEEIGEEELKQQIDKLKLAASSNDNQSVINLLSSPIYQSQS